MAGQISAEIVKTVLKKTQKLNRFIYFTQDLDVMTVLGRTIWKVLILIKLL